MFCNNTSGIPEAKIPVILYIWSNMEPRGLKGQVIFKVCLTGKKKRKKTAPEHPAFIKAIRPKPAGLDPRWCWHLMVSWFDVQEEQRFFSAFSES